MRQSVGIGVLALVLVVAGAGSVSGVAQDGTVVGHPTLSVAAVGNQTTWGSGQTVTVAISNAGTLTVGGPDRFEDDVTTARNLRVEIDDERLDRQLRRNLEFQSDTRLVGELGRGEVAEVTFAVGVRDGLAPGTYELPLRVSYDYTSFVRYEDGTNPEYTERSRTGVYRVEVVVPDRPRLEVESNQETPIETGETGQYTFTVTNTGTQTTEALSLVLETDGVSAFFGSQAVSGDQVSVFVGDLEPDESETVSVTMGAYEETSTGTYLVDVTASYRTPGGFEYTVDDLRLGVSVNRTEV
jgi:hypothetical protein